MSESKLSTIIQKAVREIIVISDLLNQDPNAVFKLVDIEIDICKKYNIPFNTIDRIMNWMTRDNENLSRFIKIKELSLSSGLQVSEIKKIANDNFITILLLNGILYVRKTVLKLIDK